MYYKHIAEEEREREIENVTERGDTHTQRERY